MNTAAFTDNKGKLFNYTTMKTFLILTVSILFPAIVNCQKVDYSQDWIRLLESPRYEKFKLKPENYFEKHKS